MPFAEFFSLNDLELDPTGRWLLVGCAFVLGSIFGSFMNVVVYRMPRGLNLSHPGSRCSVCEHPIRWYDNVPILGWLKLGGRCRDCGAPFSIRYPLVELAVAVFAALLFWQEGTAEVVASAGTLDTTIYTLRFVPYLYHLLLGCTLICAALMEFDGQVPPARMLGLMLAVGLLMPVVWPAIRTPSEEIASWPPGRSRAALEGIAGAVTAFLLGVLPWFAWFKNAGQARFRYASAALGLLIIVGTFLGDLPVATIGVVSMAQYFFVEQLSRAWPALARLGWAPALTTMTLGWLLTDGGVDADYSPLLITAAIALVLLVIGPRHRPASQTTP